MSYLNLCVLTFYVSRPKCNILARYASLFVIASGIGLQGLQKLKN